MLNRVFTVIACVLLAQFFGGCMTYHSPAKLSASEKTVVENAGLTHLTVGVVTASEEDKDHVIAFIRSLTRTGLFKEVNTASLLVTKPDLLIKLEPSQRRFYCATGPGSIVIPTIGIIPFNIGDEEDIEFTILGADRSVPVPIRYRYKGAAWWGSLISLLAVSPNWTLNKIDENRHAQRLAFLVASHKNEILPLGNPPRE